MAAQETLTPPAQADYYAIEKTIDAAHDELEQLVWRLEKMLDDEDLPATDSDVAELYSFGAMVRIRVHDFERHRERLSDLLELLDDRRLAEQRRNRRRASA